MAVTYKSEPLYDIYHLAWTSVVSFARKSIMSWRHVSVVAAAALMITAPVSAQRAGSVELGGYGVYPQFDNSLQFSNKVGYGGQLGIYIASNLAIEADVSRITTTQDGTPTDLDVSVMPLRA